MVKKIGPQDAGIFGELRDKIRTMSDESFRAWLVNALHVRAGAVEDEAADRELTLNERDYLDQVRTIQSEIRTRI